MMIRPMAVLVALTILCGPVGLASQRLTPVSPAANPFFAIPSAIRYTDDSVKSKQIPRTYWLEGAIIGGGLAGILAVLASQALRV